MTVYGLIGYPLAHTFSEKYFSNKFRESGLDDRFTYRNYELNSVAELHNLIKEQKDLAGLNVTSPYKTEVLLLMDELTVTASRVKAVNTIRITRSTNGNVTRLTGHNTDVKGFELSLLPLLNAQHTGALILGTGGASNAITAALDNLDIPHLKISSSGAGGALGYKDVNNDLLDKYPVIINATPLGSAHKADQFPPLPYELLHSGNLLFDLVYNPPETLFLRKGKAKGASIKNGYEMLTLQAEESWKFWND